VFDWDGTLADSTGLISGAILAAADDLGVPVPDRSRAAHVIGMGMLPALRAVVPDLPPARIAEFSARFQFHYRGGEQGIRLFAGVAALLAQLRTRHVRLGIATGKSIAGLRRSLESAGLADHFEAVRCADQTEAKPHPAMLLELAEEFDVAPARMLMIGDTTHDLQMAAAARVGAVGVTYGAHPRGELERLQPLAVHDTVVELHQWLLARCG